MIKSVNYWMVGGFEGELPVHEAAATAKKLGYDAIELTFGTGHLDRSVSQTRLAEMKAALDAIGLPVASLCTGNYWATSLTAEDANERENALAFTQAYIRAARALGADAVLVVPGAVDVAWDPSRGVVAAASVYERARDAIERLLPLAEEQAVTICLENVWNKFLTGPFEFAAFIDSFASRRVKAYFDVGNCMLFGYPEHWIEVLGSRIERVHLKNFTRRDGGGTLADFTGSLMKGGVDWPAVFAALKGIGYDGYLTAEVIISENGMPDLSQAGEVCREMAQLIQTHA
jgi:hexulose-6-phosphate isomerase